MTTDVGVDMTTNVRPGVRMCGRNLRMSFFSVIMIFQNVRVPPDFFKCPVGFHVFPGVLGTPSFFWMPFFRISCFFWASGCPRISRMSHCFFSRISCSFQNFQVPPNFSNVPFFPVSIWTILWMSNFSQNLHVPFFPDVMFCQRHGFSGIWFPKSNS